jgi:hypothetical protein
MFGIHQSYPRLIVLRASGVAASLLVPAQVIKTRVPRALPAELPHAP